MSETKGIMFSMTIIYIFLFWFMRGAFQEILLVNLTKKKIRMRKEGQNIIEWLTFSRFRDVIPGFVIPIYYIIMLVNTAGVMFVAYQLFLRGGVVNFSYFAKFAWFNMAWGFVLWAASFDPKYPHPRVELWVPNVKTGKTAGRYKNQKSTSGRHR